MSEIGDTKDDHALLVDRTRRLVEETRRRFPAYDEELQAVLARFDEPLRVAIAGKVKAGKSTLLNALVGERIAPTDTGECTKIVTWYQDSHTYGVRAHMREGGDVPTLPFRREERSVTIDLGGRSPDDISRLEVDWPSSSLRELTLIDTPGIDSVNAEVGARSIEFLDATERSTPADAVLYLMKHMHASDFHLLEAFHDDEVSQPNPINALAVLSRADEIGVGRLDSMASARRIAQRYETDPRLRRLVTAVVPVAGLLGETARTLTQNEYTLLSELATVPHKDLEPHLLSADRFLEASPETPGTSLDREQLLGRFGVFGIRIALVLIRRGVVNSSRELADELLKRSGVIELRETLSKLFVERSGVLKARSALLAIEKICTTEGESADDLMVQVEQITAGAHPFRELATLAALRSGTISGRPADLQLLERTVGAKGTGPAQRLGLDDDADVSAQRTAVFTQIEGARRLAESPFTEHDLAKACTVATRSLEGVLNSTPDDPS